MQKYFIGRNGELIPIVFDLDYEIDLAEQDYIDILYEIKKVLEGRLDGLKRARLEQSREMAKRENGSTSLQCNRTGQEETGIVKRETTTPKDGAGDMGGLEENKQ